MQLWIFGYSFSPQLWLTGLQNATTGAIKAHGTPAKVVFEVLRAILIAMTNGVNCRTF